LPEENVRRILDAEMDPRDKTLLNLIYVAGVRVSEATQLRWRNLCPRGDAGQVTIFGKGGVTRAVTLPSALWSELIALRGSSTVRKVAASTPALMRRRSPVGNTSSSVAPAGGTCRRGLLSTKANRTGPVCWSRFR
jgi:integrase/recombinase XerD